LPKSPRLTAADAERLLLCSGFSLLRARGSHRIYGRGQVRIVVPHHAGRILHPKTVRRVLEAIADSDLAETPQAD
jgi:predicted RNA binding protein YcfA (HicA-like mRNA interferase family)